MESSNTSVQFPLPYVIEDIRQWPIYKLSADKERFMEEVKSRTLEKLYGKFNNSKALQEEVSKVIYQERIRLTEKPWKADPKDERVFWARIKSKYIKMSDAGSNITAQQLTTEIIERYVNEITGSFDINSFNLARTLLPQFFGRVLNAAPGKWFKTISHSARTIHEKIPITGDVELIRRLALKGTLVVVPTHFSNMDSIMIGWVLNELGLPAFTYGAGLNLFSIQLLAYFMNRLGAYKVDRRKKNSFYLETLKTYSTIALQRGAHSIFFPGGTRSRSGMIEKKLKLGLLGTAVECQKLHFKNYPENIAPKLFVVPMVINYHFVLEASGLINDYLKETGQHRFLRENDEYSTSFKMIRFILKFLSASSSITISFGKVLDVFGNQVDSEGNSYNHLGKPIDNIKRYFVTNGRMTDDQQREEEYTKILGERIVEQYWKANTVLTSHLVCFTLFELIKQQFRHVDLFTMLRTPQDEISVSEELLLRNISALKDRLKIMSLKGELLLSPEIRWPADKILEHGMRNVNFYHVASPVKRRGNHFTSEDLKLLFYYHNRLDGYQLHEYLVA
ncbi:MAG: 1-acyl-sn-glycerol-3-phosphate acyltransferase [Chitinophagales bacterium]|nr:1-acyl-sn-glycerol-3-phosphate acyltransferase [Chitinophagales bacterium]